MDRFALRRSPIAVSEEPSSTATPPPPLPDTAAAARVTTATQQPPLPETHQAPKPPSKLTLLEAALAMPTIAPPLLPLASQQAAPTPEDVDAMLEQQPGDQAGPVPSPSHSHPFIATTEPEAMSPNHARALAASTRAGLADVDATFAATFPAEAEEDGVAPPQTTASIQEHLDRLDAQLQAQMARLNVLGDATEAAAQSGREPSREAVAAEMDAAEEQQHMLQLHQGLRNLAQADALQASPPHERLTARTPVSDTTASIAKGWLKQARSNIQAREEARARARRAINVLANGPKVQEFLHSRPAPSTTPPAATATATARSPASPAATATTTARSSARPAATTTATTPRPTVNGRLDSRRAVVETSKESSNTEALRNQVKASYEAQVSIKEGRKVVVFKASRKPDDNVVAAIGERSKSQFRVVGLQIGAFILRIFATLTTAGLIWLSNSFKELDARIIRGCEVYHASRQMGILPPTIG